MELDSVSALTTPTTVASYEQRLSRLACYRIGLVRLPKVRRYLAVLANASSASATYRTGVFPIPVRLFHSCLRIFASSTS